MELMTVRETAAELKVSPITVRRYIASGKLVAVRVGRNVRISRQAIDRLVKPLPVAPPETEETAVPAKPLTLDSPLWDIVGIIHGGPSDFSENHDRYLAEAYTDPHET